MNRHVGALRWAIRKTFGNVAIPYPGEAGVFWFRPSEYPIHLKGPWGVEADIAREWKALLRPGEVILDIGANIGFTAQRFHAILKGKCQIFAFEPLPRNAALLRRNVAGIAHVVEMAVGDRNGKIKFIDNRRHGGLSKLGDIATPASDADFWRDVEVVEVPITTLDNYLHVKPTFIKLDVEGAGHLALRGAMQTLRECKPVVSASLHSDEERDGIVSILGGLGYRGVHVRNDRCLWCDLESAENFVHPESARAKHYVMG